VSEFQTLESLRNPDPVWGDFLSLIIKEIKNARSDVGSAGKVSAGLTDREHECFKNCLEILGRAQADVLLSTEPVSRPTIKL
jgi:hypothetical protein